MQVLFGKGEYIQNILGTFLILMGVSQALSFSSFTRILFDYQFFNPGLLFLYAFVLIVSEIGSGIGIILTTIPKESKKYSFYTAAIIFLIWAVLGVQALVRGLDIQNTGYFGSLIPIPFGWWIIVINSGFAFLGLLVIQRMKRYRVFKEKRTRT